MIKIIVKIFSILKSGTKINEQISNLLDELLEKISTSVVREALKIKDFCGNGYDNLDKIRNIKKCLREQVFYALYGTPICILAYLIFSSMFNINSSTVYANPLSSIPCFLSITILPSIIFSAFTLQGIYFTLTYSNSNTVDKIVDELVQ